MEVFFFFPTYKIYFYLNTESERGNSFFEKSPQLCSVLHWHYYNFQWHVKLDYFIYFELEITV